MYMTNASSCFVLASLQKKVGDEDGDHDDVCTID